MNVRISACDILDPSAAWLGPHVSKARFSACEWPVGFTPISVPPLTSAGNDFKKRFGMSSRALIFFPCGHMTFMQRHINDTDVVMTLLRRRVPTGCLPRGLYPRKLPFLNNIRLRREVALISLCVNMLSIVDSDSSLYASFC